MKSNGIVNRPRVLAYYLPQYHHVKENDEWWGKGFTEWTAVQHAEKYYDSHYEPRVPLNKNYYNLDNKDTFLWQADLARKYGVDGFVFFHYYFGKGRKILEKPCENLLKWPDVCINYCFSWANRSWIRSWGNIAGGSMHSKFEKYDTSANSVLLLQQYGDKADWKKHFDYLLPFFNDERYIKKDGKPVFIFHNAEEIACLEAMVECWRILAKKHGFSGLYLIGNITNNCTEYPMLDAIYAHEPSFLLSEYPPFSDPAKRFVCNRYNNYAEVCDWSARRFYCQKQKLYYGTFVGFDNTPRHAHRGAIIDGCTPETFRKSFGQIYARSMQADNDMVFINAWNEWGEGNYLEPDEKFGYGFLEAVRAVAKGSSAIGEMPCVPFDAQAGNVIGNITLRALKAERLCVLLDKWISVLGCKQEVYDALLKKNAKTIAIYGYGKIGKFLFNQLRNTPLVKVRCIIDQKVKIQGMPVPFFTLSDSLPAVDMIIVTVDVPLQSIKERARCMDVVHISTILDELLGAGETVETGGGGNRSIV